MIFNKDSTGAVELKSLLGFIYKSSNFANMISFIGFAERDIRKVTGDAVFEVAQVHYLGENYRCSVDEDHPEYIVLDNLVQAIQLPVALHAYRRFALQNDLGHSDKGRFITVTETEKPAFEWMIEKSDKSLVELAHEATDMLLEFLDSHIGYKTPGVDGVIVIPWGTSVQLATLRELLISKDQLNQEFFLQDSRRVFLCLIPFLRHVQSNEILACIGKERYDLISAALQSGTIPDEIEGILQKIRPALCFLALSRAVIRLSIEILPDGLFTNFITGTINNKAASAIPHRFQVSQSLLQQGMAEMSKLQEYLSRLNAEETGLTYEPVDLTARFDPLQKYVRL
jgi:hypothetical protein